MKKITILGAGTWGTALAAMLKNENGHDVVLWSAIPEELDNLSKNKKHPNLEGMVLPDGLIFESDITMACCDADFIIFAVPSPYVRETAGKISSTVTEKTIIANVAKGLEMTLRSFSEVMERLGVKEIESLGKTFDPELHNAVFHVDDESYGEQEIVEVLQKGYTIGDKVLRYAMVKVAN